ncbi:MAG: HAMP domain-containing histidine kinase [Acidobacteria bacterium]|nr:HAMP domain-containing histidine kinase [Acidobacteriota bacterium]MBV9623239.1 HAMP domain-containing histidine kinase [Acidobacteriota bacterium]
MRFSRRGKIIFFLSLGVLLAGTAVAVGFGWIIVNWREGAKVLLGIIFFAAIATGLILNTGFLVREIRKNEQHDSFINAVTHELKTPIASIRLYLETLQARQVDAGERQEFFRLMIEDTDRLTRTVEQVLKAGKAGARKGERVPVDFSALVERCVDSARASHRLSASALRFRSDVNGTGSEVSGDPEDLSTAVSNILDNAVKYSGQDVDVSVELGLEGEKRLVLRVRDRGVGIPSAQLRSVFKRFYRVPGRALPQARGTGLGLFLVRTIAKRHGGRVSAESAGEGRGATFILELPRRLS